MNEAQIQAISDRMSLESDRACAVLGVATLDVLLQELLVGAMVADTPKEIFKGHGPCATLSAKIDLAFALGIVPREQRSDLHSLRKIRNDFAHDVNHELDFNAQNIANRIGSLSIPTPLGKNRPIKEIDPSPRFHFEMAITKQMLSLLGSAELRRKQQVKNQ